MFHASLNGSFIIYPPAKLASYGKKSSNWWMFHIYVGLLDGISLLQVGAPYLQVGL